MVGSGIFNRVAALFFATAAFAAFHPISALVVDDPLGVCSNPEREDLAALFATLTPAFVNGDFFSFKERLSEGISTQRRSEIFKALDAEYHKVQYQFFIIDKLTIAGRLTSGRYEVRADISYSYRGRSGNPPFKDSEISHFFVLEKEAHAGRFFFVDSPGLFDTIGLETGEYGLAARFYIMILLLFAAAFWVWMIADSFHRHVPMAWRATVAGLPILGALIYVAMRLAVKLKKK
jgi:hypothetical protein